MQNLYKLPSLMIFCFICVALDYYISRKYTNETSSYLVDSTGEEVNPFMMPGDAILMPSTEEQVSPMQYDVSDLDQTGTVTPVERETDDQEMFEYQSIDHTTPHVPLETIDKDGINRDQEEVDTRPNILFIVSDDLRPQLNPYRSLFASSQFEMYTPNLDALADRSLVLMNAFSQYSLCNPSRASYMTSRRPDTTRVWDLKAYWRDSGGNFTTIPQYFKDHGYYSQGLGKIYHPKAAGGWGDPLSWSEPHFIPETSSMIWGKKGVHQSWRAVNQSEREQYPLPDEEITSQAVKLLHTHAETKNKRKPFLMAVGLNKPHLPFVIPEEFLELYTLQRIPLANCPFVPKNYPATAFRENKELLSCSDLATLGPSYLKMNTTLPRSISRAVRRAYFAAVSYIDHLVGILLGELKLLGLEDSTIVTFMGDHGWHLGENGIWGKHSEFDRGLQVPLMIHVPGKTNSGLVSHSLVELTDIFPTLVELTGHGSLPRCPEASADISLCTEGESFAPLVSNPRGIIRDAVYSQIRHRNPRAMSYTIRTERYRYTELVPVKQTRYKQGGFSLDLRWNSSLAVELYDHLSDPGENVNVANEPTYHSLCKVLHGRLVERVTWQIDNIRTPLF